MKHRSTTFSAAAIFILLGMNMPGVSYCQIPNLPEKQTPFDAHLVRSSSSNISISEKGFVENKGQLADQNGKLMPEVLYTADSKGMKCYLTEKGMHFVFARMVSPIDETIHSQLPDRRKNHNEKADTLILQRLDMEFVGANPHPYIEAEDMRDEYFNYYLAHCKLTGVRAFGKIIYHDLYPYIDCAIYTKDGESKYDFIIHPGGDPNMISMRYSGMDSLWCSEDGKFKVYTPLGDMEEDEPVTYQIGEGRIPIESHFLLSGNVIRFRIGNYDKTNDLVIDPLRRMWGTYFGGGVVLDIGQSPVVDKENNIIFCGVTKSTSGIATTGSYQATLAGAQDVFMAKFSSAGALIWATYFGGSKDEFSAGMALDSNDFCILYGETFSSSGIATAGSHQTTLSGLSDAFLAKFDNTGVQVWATYFGGDGGEEVGGNRSIACDRGGHICITGSTFSHTGLTTTGAWDTVLFGVAEDAFLARFTATGTLMWATLYGGTLDDHGWAIAVDRSDNIYFGGSTSSTTAVATTTGFQSVYGGGQKDAFIARFNSVGALFWATYYGGNDDDYLSGLCVDSAGNIYGCGYTTSKSGIASPGAFQTNIGSTTNGSYDAFILKLNPLGKRQWATYFGGAYGDYAEDIEVNSDKLLISGETRSLTSISTPPTYKDNIELIINPDTTWSNDAFLTRFSFSGSRLWATYYGGEVSDYGYGCALDRDDNLILVGETQSTQHVASPNGFDTSGGWNDPNFANIDAYVVKLCDMAIPVLSGKSDTICIEGIDTLRLNQGYDHIDWFDGNTHLTSATDSLFYILTSPQTSGQHSIYVYVSNGAQCDAYSDTIKYFVDAPPVVTARTDTAVCPGTSVQLSAKVQGGIAPYTYFWTPAAGLNDQKKINPIATPQSTTTYYLSITDKFGCSGIDSVTITINTPPQLNPTLSDTICAGSSKQIGDSASGAKPPYLYSWLPRLGLNRDNVAEPIASPKATTTYTETVTDANGCQSQKVITVTVIPLPIPIIAGPNAVCVNSSDIYANIGLGKGSYNWTLNSGGTISILPHPDSISVLWATAGTWVLTLTVTNAEGCSADTSFSVTVGTSLTPTVTPNGNLNFCTGDSLVLHASKGYTSYLWSDGSTSDSIVIKKSGNFSVTVTSSGGCIGTSSVTTITENPSPVFTVTADGPTHLCSGSSVHLTATSGFDKYLWSSGETTPTISVSAAGSYTVQVTNSFGCSLTSQPIVVTIDANLTPAITAEGPLSFCLGDSVTLDAGSGYATYQWSKDGSLIPNAISEKIVVGQPGSYTVAVTSGSCSGTSTPIVVIVFSLPPQPVISLSGSVLTSTSAVTYQWNFNGQPISGETNQFITPSLNGTYTVRITGANGCSNISVPFAFGVSASARVRVGAVSPVNPGEEIEIPIELLSSQNLIPSSANHYVGILRYNGTMLVPTVSIGGTLAASNSVTGSSDRTIGFEGFSAPMTSGTLQKIKFDASLGNDTCTILTIDTFYWLDAVVSVIRENGDFCESGICIAGGAIRLVDGSGKLSMGAIHPNPAGSHILLDYDLLETGRTQLILSDGIGRKVRVIQDAEQKAGHYNVDIPLQDISSGYYQLMLKTPSQYLSRSFVVQK